MDSRFYRPASRSHIHNERGIEKHLSVVTQQRRIYFRLLVNQLKYDLQMKFIGSLAGVYWALLNPLLQVGTYVVLLTVVLRARIGATEGGTFDYAIFVLAAMGPWLATQEALTATSTAIVRNASIVRNVVFPLELLPMSAALSSLVSLAVSLSVLFVLLAVSGKFIGLSIVAFPLVLLVQLLLILGIGYFLAVVSTFLRDVTYILPVVLMLVMLCTPIVYGIEDMPPLLRFATHFNPFYYLTDSYRQIFYYSHWPHWPGLVGLGVGSVVTLMAGLFVFRKTKGYFEAVLGAS